MAEILSQEEIDALLNALSSGEVSEEEADQKTAKTKSIKIWDFHRPDRFSKEQTRTLQMLHDHFARLFSGRISAFLRTLIEARLDIVDQITYDEFIRSLSNPTCLTVLKMHPLERNAMLEFSPQVAFWFVERMMGGRGGEFTKNRELTDIEQSLLMRIVELICASLAEAWQKVIKLEPSADMMETNPQMFLQANLPGDMVILMTFEIALGESTGTIGLCLPHSVLEPVMSRLTTQSWLSEDRKAQDEVTKANIESRLTNVSVCLSALLGTAEVTARDILDLKVGDVVTLHERVDTELPVLVEGKLKFYGKPGVWGPCRAVKITRLASEELEVVG